VADSSDSKNSFDGSSSVRTGTLVSFDQMRKARKDRELYARWVEFYTQQTHEDLLSALVYEHENNFPLRSSEDSIDHLRHRAMVDVLQVRARTEFLKAFLKELEEKNLIN
jgi:hypothetical protein